MATPADTGVSSDLSKDPFISTLRDTLTSQSGAISSADSNIESKINEAIAGVSKSNEASKAATASAFNRNIGYQQDKNISSEATFTESQRGFATNTAAFRSLVDYNRKAINDLEQRKQELLMQGDSAAASKIADLTLSKLDFENKAAQQTFTNLLSLGSFSLQQKGVEQAAKAQNFTESQAISGIALKYGIAVEAGDTIDTITKKAAPFASAEEKLAMDATRATINEKNASAAKALSDLKANTPLDATSLEALARAYISNPGAVSGVVKTTAQLGQILSKVGEVTMADLNKQIETNKANGGSKSDDINAVNKNTNLSPQQKADALTKIEAVYGPDSEQKTTSGGLPEFTGNVAKGTYDVSSSILNWLSGTNNTLQYRK